MAFLKIKVTFLLKVKLLIIKLLQIPGSIFHAAGLEILFNSQLKFHVMYVFILSYPFGKFVVIIV
jgi:hypothetical protein